MTGGDGDGVGSMPGRALIVNADDLGRSPGVNRGIARAHEHGIVTSASLLVRWPAAHQAAAYVREHALLSTGLHVDLGEWAYRNGEWIAVYEVVPAADETAVAAEFDNQLTRFRNLVGDDPTHLDSHQHVHRDEPARSLLAGFGERLGVPVRSLSPQPQHVGAFYGQTGSGGRHPEWISVAHLVSLLRSLEPGVSELGCHPGLDGDAGGIYSSEREVEVQTLCDPRVRTVLIEEGITLCNRAGRVTVG